MPRDDGLASLSPSIAACFAALHPHGMAKGTSQRAEHDALLRYNRVWTWENITITVRTLAAGSSRLDKPLMAQEYAEVAEHETFAELRPAETYRRSSEIGPVRHTGGRCGRCHLALDQQEQLGDFEPGELDSLLAEGERSIQKHGTIDGDEAFRRRRERRARARKQAQ